MDNLEITNMTIIDFEKIESILNTEFDDFWTPLNLKSALNNSDSKYIVAKLDNKIIGFAGVWFSVDDAHITNIVVHKNYRHIGIGSKLLEALISLAQIKTSLTLEVNVENKNAQELYLKYGFKNLGIRKKYYKCTQDAYIMTLFFNNKSLD